MSARKVVLSAVLGVGLFSSTVFAHEDVANSGSNVPEKLGTAHFETSCTPVAQAKFDRALTMLHSFFYPETIKAFGEVAETDPQCGIAYWGLAMSIRPNPLVGPFDTATLQRGLDASRKGISIGAGTQRERDYLAAIELFYKDFDKVDQKTRTLAYEKAMERIYLRYPEDREAAVFYALSLNEAASEDDRTYANQLKSAAILEKIDAEQPDHPGVAHYLIHSYDYTPLATRGLPAATKYAKIAPSAPHALHMPSHIFSMLGMWDESIRSNEASIVVVREVAAKNWPGAVHPGELHAMDFMEYAYLQEGRNGSARELVDRVRAVRKVAIPSLAADTAMAAIPARYALERGAWSEAAALEVRPSRYPQAEAITRFGRALGSARSGDLAGARTEIEKLKAIQDTLKQTKQEFWVGQTEIQIRAASAWLEHAEGRNDEAVRLMRSAADLDDASGKQVAMENRLVPMRELLGYMLLEIKEPAQALGEFEAALQGSPNRLRGFYGAALAANMSGNSVKAKAYFTKLSALGIHADSGRAELQDAKRFLTTKTGPGKECTGC